MLGVQALPLHAAPPCYRQRTRAQSIPFGLQITRMLRYRPRSFNCLHSLRLHLNEPRLVGRTGVKTILTAARLVTRSTCF